MAAVIASLKLRLDTPKQKLGSHRARSGGLRLHCSRLTSLPLFEITYTNLRLLFRPVAEAALRHRPYRSTAPQCSACSERGVHFERICL